jgi:hypothetical protein
MNYRKGVYFDLYSEITLALLVSLRVHIGEEMLCH